MAIVFDDFTEYDHQQVKGRGNAPQRSVVFRRLEAIKEHAVKAKTRKAFRVAAYGNHSTACGVARAITRANTDDMREGDQKCPSGRWMASVRRTEEGTVVFASFLGENK